MFIFDLVFIASFLTTVILVFRILLNLARRNYRRARRAFIQLGVFWAIYMAVLLAVSFLTPQRVLGMHEDRCFDDWCLSVEDCLHVPDNSQARYIVRLQVSSRARRVSQRAPDAAVYLIDAKGEKYFPSPQGQGAYDTSHADNRPLGALLGPLESFSTVRVFDLPLQSTDASLAVVHGQGPGQFIIGNSNSLFHKRTVTKLQCRQGN